jgi:hypothetical protein
MKRILILAVLCAYPFVVQAHPGKTDRHGGHRCLKECEEWTLFYDEYHLHDKDWKPIRIEKSKRRAVKPAAKPEEPAVIAEEPTPPQPAPGQVSAALAPAPAADDPVLFPDRLLWALLVLFLLLLVMRRRRARREKSA